MDTDDSPTRPMPPPAERTGGRGPVLPALTIIWHPDLDRVGEIAPLTELLKGEVVPLTRREPIFRPPGSDDGRPIGDSGMNRGPALEVSAAADVVELRRGTANTLVEVDGVPFDKTRRISSDALRRGVILTVGRQFVFCLHAVRFPVTRGPNLGLLGTSDAIEDVRRAIALVADRSTPQLILGESGTGKELVAEALHAAGPRRSRPLIRLNMAVLDANRAVAELFGYKKGAFTGATADVPGYFQSAEGGTLFFDELGLTSVEVQHKLLRVVDDGEIRPLGSAKARKVDVRIVAATDAKLEQAVAEARFNKSFYNRFSARSPITLPPLRERREDVGVLLVHFLREKIGDSELHRLQAPDQKSRAWLSAENIAAVARSHLPKNVRGLKGLADDLASAAKATPRADADKIVAEFLKGDLSDHGPAESATAQPAPPHRYAECTSDELLAVLESTDWNRTPAAGKLNVSRATFLRWLRKYPELHRVADVSIPELRQEIEACGGNLEDVAKKLGTSVMLVRRRLGRHE